MVCARVSENAIRSKQTIWSAPAERSGDWSASVLACLCNGPSKLTILFSILSLAELFSLILPAKTLALQSQLGALGIKRYEKPHPTQPSPDCCRHSSASTRSYGPTSAGRLQSEQSSAIVRQIRSQRRQTSDPWSAP